jgi:hypothetical protein
MHKKIALSLLCVSLTAAGSAAARTKSPPSRPGDPERPIRLIGVPSATRSRARAASDVAD